MSCDLIKKAKEIDRKNNAGVRKTVYTDEEIMLAGEWFEGGVTTGAVAEVMKLDKTNVINRMCAAIKQGLASGRVRFVWLPKAGTEDGKAKNQIR